tara:strand:- start:3916 stop:4098 length:183 start_codon:yes stop_codon:yes gene_type:complete
MPKVLERIILAIISGFSKISKCKSSCCESECQTRQDVDNPRSKRRSQNDKRSNKVKTVDI